MSESRARRIAPVRHQDLVPNQRIAFPGNSLIVGHPRRVVCHTRVISASDSGSWTREQRQHGYNDSDNHPLDAHSALPDLGLEIEWEKECQRYAGLFQLALGIDVS